MPEHETLRCDRRLDRLVRAQQDRLLYLDAAGVNAFFLVVPELAL